MTLHTLCRGAWNSPGVVLSVLITVSTLTGCHGGGGSSPVVVAFGDNLGGTLKGLVGSGLVLQNPIQLNGPGANGTDVLFGSARLNTSYDLTVATQPTNPSQTCVVANGTGIASGTIYAPSNVTNITVACTTNPPRFLYVANRGSNNVSAYTIGAGGALSAVSGSPFATGTSPASVAVNPHEYPAVTLTTYVYVANATSNTLSGYNIYNNNQGMPAVLSGSPYKTGSGPNSVAVDPLDNFVCHLQSL
jgi:6-phosphogluconolactonase